MASGPEVIKKSCLTQLSMKYFLLINVKMSTIVGIFTFMSRKIAFWAYLSLKTADQNFLAYLYVPPGIFFIIFGPDLGPLL